ncbi:TPA: hypothetical protein ACH3X2_013703 [Trebouxia sp. C0005]
MIQPFAVPRKFGSGWLFRHLIPVEATGKVPVLEVLMAAAKAGMPVPVDLTSNLGDVPLVVPTPLSCGVPSGSLPSAAQASALLPPTSPASVSAPSSTASLGKHFKADLPRPDLFRQLDSSADISCWLLRMEEYLNLMNYDPSIRSVDAAQFLGRAPRDPWDSFTAKSDVVTASLSLHTLGLNSRCGVLLPLIFMTRSSKL